MEETTLPVILSEANEWVECTTTRVAKQDVLRPATAPSRRQSVVVVLLYLGRSDLAA